MQDLRLIGVREDGMHLILGDEQGRRFSLPLDDHLRAAARPDHGRPGQLALELREPLRPKDVQAMIRAGLTADEVAERAGWTVEKVHRYEVPILAEREHVAGLARQVRLRPRGEAHGAAPTLEDRVSERLRSREIDASAARWDSRRADRGSWTVLLDFTAGGRQRKAMWDFDPLARIVVARDDEARWLSEDEAAELPGPIPAPHLAATGRPSRVYDVEAEGGIDGPLRAEDETVDLMAAMRERSAQRGRRRRSRANDVPGIEQAPVEALPLSELARDPEELGPPPAAHPHPADESEAARDSGEPPEARAHDRQTAAASVQGETVDDSETAARAGAREPTPRPGRAEGGAGGARRTAATEPLPSNARRTGTDGASGETQATTPGVQSRAKPPPARRSGRPSVPSWDDIVFGRKPD